MKTVTIDGQLRTESGKKQARILRSEGNALGVIYGGDKEVHFSAPLISFRDIVYTPEFKIAEINVDGKTYKCILKDLQFDAVTDVLLHADFLELVEGKKIIANMPIKLEGQAAGVRSGGRLEQKMNTLKVRTYPKNLKESFVLDISKLKLNANLRVEDVAKQNPDFEFMNPLRQPVVSVGLTRALRQAGTTGDDAEETEGTEGGAEQADGAAAAE